MKSVNSSKALLSSGLIMAAGMLLGRAAGFVREIILAKYFGVSESADIAVLMLTLPDLLIALFIGGATNIVLIPLFQETKKESQFSSFVFFSLLIFFCFAILSLGLSLLTLDIVQWLAPGLNPDSQSTASELFRWVLIAVPLTALASVSRAYLQSSQRFATTSMENLFYNFAVIAGIALLTPQWGLKAVLISIFVGVFLRWFSQLCNILSYEKIRVQLRQVRPDRTLFRNYFQALGAGMILVFLPIIARSIASLFAGDGAVAIFNYSYKLIELPFGVAISVFSIIIFPKLSQMIRNKEEKRSIDKLFSNSLFLLYCFCLPVCLGLIGLFIGLGSTDFSVFSIPKESLRDIGTLSILGFIALPFRGFSSLHLAILSAYKDTRSPLLINIAAVLLAFPLCYFLTEWSSTTDSKFFGLGIALLIVYSFIYLCEVSLLYFKYSINATKELFSIRSLKVLTISVANAGIFFWAHKTLLPSAIATILLSGVFVLSCFLFMALLDQNFKGLVLKSLKKA